MRFWEIDLVRGIAVILMILFNYSFALYYFQIYTINGGILYWWLFPRVIASAFIFLSGLSLTISYSRNRRWKKHAKRGLKIFSLGLLITFITLLALPSSTVFFGVLHLIGLSIILGFITMRLKIRYIIIFAIVILLISAYLNNLIFDFPYLLWLGFIPEGFVTLDYFPVLPWFGVFLLGIAFGKTKYRNGKRTFKISKEPGIIRRFNILGRHSLIIYLLHIPVLIAALYAAGLL